MSLISWNPKSILKLEAQCSCKNCVAVTCLVKSHKKNNMNYPGSPPQGFSFRLYNSHNVIDGEKNTHEYQKKSKGTANNHNFTNKCSQKIQNQSRHATCMDTPMSKIGKNSCYLIKTELVTEGFGNNTVNVKDKISQKKSHLDGYKLNIKYKEIYDSLLLNIKQNSAQIEKLATNHTTVGLKGAYKACSCKICECITSNSPLKNKSCNCKPCDCKDCLALLRKLESTKCVNIISKHRNILQHGCKAVFNNPQSCDCKPCDCPQCLISNYSCKGKPNKLTVASSTKNIQLYDCQCKPCGCIECTIRNLKNSTYAIHKTVPDCRYPCPNKLHRSSKSNLHKGQGKEIVFKKPTMSEIYDMNTRKHFSVEGKVYSQNNVTRKPVKNTSNISLSSVNYLSHALFRSNARLTDTFDLLPCNCENWSKMDVLPSGFETTGRCDICTCEVCSCLSCVNFSRRLDSIKTSLQQQPSHKCSLRSTCDCRLCTCTHCQKAISECIGDVCDCIECRCLTCLKKIRISKKHTNKAHTNKATFVKLQKVKKIINKTKSINNIFIAKKDASSSLTNVIVENKNITSSPKPVKEYNTFPLMKGEQIQSTEYKYTIDNLNQNNQSLRKNIGKFDSQEKQSECITDGLPSDFSAPRYSSTKKPKISEKIKLNSSVTKTVRSCSFPPLETKLNDSLKQIQIDNKCDVQIDEIDTMLFRNQIDETVRNVLSNLTDLLCTETDQKRAWKTLHEAKNFSLELANILEKYEKANAEYVCVNIPGGKTIKDPETEPSLQKLCNTFSNTRRIPKKLKSATEFESLNLKYNKYFISQKIRSNPDTTTNILFSSNNSKHNIAFNNDYDVKYNNVLGKILNFNVKRDELKIVNPIVRYRTNCKKQKQILTHYKKYNKLVKLAIQRLRYIPGKVHFVFHASKKHKRAKENDLVLDNTQNNIKMKNEAYGSVQLISIATSAAITDLNSKGEKIHEKRTWTILNKNCDLEISRHFGKNEILAMPQLQLDIKTLINSISLQTKLGEVNAINDRNTDISKLQLDDTSSQTENHTVDVGVGNIFWNYKRETKKQIKEVLRAPYALESTEKLNKLKDDLVRRNTKANFKSRCVCDGKPRFVDVRRMTNDTVMVEWSTPQDLTEVKGYELLVDGRVTQKVFNPKRNMAALTSVSNDQNVLLTIRTITEKAMHSGRYPADTVIYHPRVRR